MNALIGLLLFGGIAIAQDGSAPMRFANLCGWYTGCWCHEVGKERRCWTTPEDCEVDRSCCAETKSCKSTPYLAETCGKRTSEARKKRDAEKRKP